MRRKPCGKSNEAPQPFQEEKDINASSETISLPTIGDNPVARSEAIFQEHVCGRPLFHFATAHWNCVRKGKGNFLDIFAGSARFRQRSLTGFKVGTCVDRNEFDVMTDPQRTTHSWRSSRNSAGCHPHGTGAWIMVEYARHPTKPTGLRKAQTLHPNG